ncbi:MAG: hypothetical protein ACM3ZQ_10905 [Bacillota bacterium]
MEVPLVEGATRDPELTSHRVQMSGYGKVLVTRKSGEKVRLALSALLDQRREPMVLELDFAGVAIVDYSFADEVIVRVLVNALAKSYGEKYLVLLGLNPDLEENVAVSLQQRGYGLLVQDDGRWQVIGNCKDHLLQALEMINQRGCITARDLADDQELAINTASNRLMDLYRAGLAYRSERILPGGGKQFAYSSLLRRDV